MNDLNLYAEIGPYECIILTKGKKYGSLNLSKKYWSDYPPVREIPRELGELSHLKELVISGNELIEIPDNIRSLVNLVVLNLSDNIIDKMPEGACKLLKLKDLNMSFNNITEIPKKVGLLRRLEKLSFQNNFLDAIPESVGELKKLKILNLSGNNIIRLPAEISELTRLEELNLSGNLITGLPLGISKLKNLKKLDLSNNQLVNLPADFEQLNGLSYLNLSSNAMNFPPEICDQHEYPSRVLNYYFKNIDIQTAKKPINESKLIFVGQGGVGKTSLVNMLISSNFDENEPKTTGIEIHRLKIDLNQNYIKLNIWDFGGQEIMHATHQFFLTKRSLYVVVVDSRQDEFNNRLEYWLKIIRNFGGNSPVIVVCNKCDMNVLELNWKGLKNKYPNIKKFIRQASCKNNLGIHDLREAIKREIYELDHIHDEFSLSWFKVKKYLETMDKDYIAYSEYDRICQKNEIYDEQSKTTLISLLHDLGVILHFIDRRVLKETNVLNPEWVTKGVYKILNDSKLNKRKGRLNEEDLINILDPVRYPKERHEFIIEMMKKFEICFSMDNFGAYEERRVFLVPDLLSKEEPHMDNFEKALSFEYHYDVLTSSVISRFIVRSHVDIKNNLYWRNGVVLVYGENENTALVKADLEENKIRIDVIGNDETRKTFLEIIRSNFNKIHKVVPKLRVKEKVPLPDNPDIVVDYRHLLTLRDLNEAYFVPEGLRQRVSVSLLIDGIDIIDVGNIVLPSYQNKLKAKKEEDSDNDSDAKVKYRYKFGLYIFFLSLLLSTLYAVISNYVQWYALPLIVIASLISIVILEAGVLLSKGDISEGGYLKIILEATKQMTTTIKTFFEFFKAKNQPDKPLGDKKNEGSTD